ncbi:MAG: GtrA family protein [Methanomassiliicoccaceae archaeon]|nr:GtrA family protein [Methanomassiliicoccaceae archaeon]
MTHTTERTPIREMGVMFVKFTAFSIGAGIIELISFTLLNEGTHLNYWLSYTIALVLSVVYNFTINRRYTFRSVNNIPVAMSLVLLFYCAFAPYSIWLTDRLTDGSLFGIGSGWNEYLVLIVVMVQNLVLEFLWWRFVVFKKSINTRPRRTS